MTSYTIGFGFVAFTSRARTGHTVNIDSEGRGRVLDAHPGCLAMRQSLLMV